MQTDGVSGGPITPGLIRGRSAERSATEHIK